MFLIVSVPVSKPDACHVRAICCWWDHSSGLAVTATVTKLLWDVSSTHSVSFDKVRGVRGIYLPPSTILTVIACMCARQRAGRKHT